MRNILSVAASLLAISSVIPVASAQNYTPLDPNAKAAPGASILSVKNISTERLGLDLFRTNIKSLASLKDDKPAIFPECSPAPAVSDIGGTMNYKRALISNSAAFKLGMPVGGGGSAEGNQMVFVQDYARTKECLATDGLTRLLYGQTIRTIITIANYDTQASLTLPAIAASATISGKSNSVQIQVFGFNNDKIQKLVSSISDKELNVETYATFAKIQGDLIALTTEAGTNQSMERLGIVTSEEPDNLKSNVVAAFALQQIKDGRSCNDAKSKFKEPAAPAASAIGQAYVFITSTCTSVAPTAAQKEKATDYLQGLRVKY
jgi:hypothetical protein